MKHVATTLKYNDVVLYEQGGVQTPARVLQSTIIPIPDKDADGGLRYEEHLIIETLNPKYDKTILSQMEMDQANTRMHGVQEKSDTVINGFIRINPITPLTQDATSTEAEQQELQSA